MPFLARTAASTLAGWLCCTMSYAGGCPAPVAPAAFPEPTTASELDIVNAQQSVKKYLGDMEEALKCLSAMHNDAAYNRAVENMQKTAAAFNGVIRAFKARQRNT